MIPRLSIPNKMSAQPGIVWNRGWRIPIQDGIRRGGWLGYYRSPDGAILSCSKQLMTISIFTSPPFNRMIKKFVLHPLIYLCYFQAWLDCLEWYSCTAFLFRDSSMVERVTVNHHVAGSSPARGVLLTTTITCVSLGLWLFCCFFLWINYLYSINLQ